MRIALVILHADPTRGGAERYTVDLANALVKAGHDVSILHTDPDHSGGAYRSVSLSVDDITRTSRYRRFLHGVDAHITIEQYDIVHAMLPVNRCDVYHPHAGMAVQAWNQTPLIGRSFNPRRGAFARVERGLLWDFNPPIVLCLSDYVKSAVLESYPDIEPHLATLFNAVDLDRFVPTPQAPAGHEDEVIALMVAQDFERKGLDVTLNAMKLLDDRRLMLVVVGKPNPSSWQRQAEELGIAEQILFAGPQCDVVPYYHVADFFVLPTKHDPCSLVVLESIACGVPVVSTRANGACEIMTNGTHGFVLDDPNDVAALAEAMRSMLDVSTREQMRQACIELRTELSYERHLQTLMEVYQRVMIRRQDANAS